MYFTFKGPWGGYAFSAQGRFFFLGSARETSHSVETKYCKETVAVADVNDNS